MIPFKMTVNDVENVVQFPQSYSDLTYGQMLKIRLEYAGDLGHLLEILTDVPRSLWMNLPLSQAEKITSYLAWVAQPPKWEELPLPATLTVKGVAYKIPSNLGFETFGQKITVENKVAQVVGAAFNPPAQPNAAAPTPESIKRAAAHKNATSLIAFIPYITAVYMQPKITGKPFDETEIVATEFDILAARAVEVYPIGAFFIRTTLGLTQSGPTPSVTLKAQPKPASTTRKRVSKKSKKKRGTSSRSTA